MISSSVILFYFAVLSSNKTIHVTKITMGISPITRTMMQDLVELQRYLVS